MEYKHDGCEASLKSQSSSDSLSPPIGSSCMDNVIEGRLRRAQDLLEYSEYSIRDISEQCGYNNVEHFCRQFRQHNGCTPGQYRKNASAGSNKRLLTHNTLGGREFEKINRNIRK